MNSNIYHTEIHKSFLQIVRLGIGHPASNLSESVDLAAVKALAAKQGLSAVVLDGIDKLRVKSGELRVNLQEKILLAEWIGEVHQFYEQRYEQYLQAISSLAKFYNSHGFKMMVLKGYACSLDWPNPEHRPCGDIDIWLFNQQKEADAALEVWFKSLSGSTCSPSVQEFKIDSSHHHHTVFNWQGFMVENHYDFVNVHARKSSKELEKVFKELGADDSHSVEVLGEKVYLPSPNLHALFLAKHMASHFTGAYITLRQVLDWAFFVEKHSSLIDWEWLNRMLTDFHLKDFMNSINAICVDELGFDAKIFPSVQFNPEIKKRVFNDIIHPEFEAVSPKLLIPRLIYKYRRWQGNAWKQRLCYNESRWSAFWGGIWAKILKPSSI